MDAAAKAPSGPVIGWSQPRCLKSPDNGVRQLRWEPIVTVQATDMAASAVHCSQLADGKLIQLTGHLGPAEMPALRRALLAPLFPGCRDIVIDAGEVDALDDEAVAVIVAADEWATYAGARLILSRATPVVEQALTELDFADRIRRLSELGSHERRPALVSVPRESTD